MRSRSAPLLLVLPAATVLGTTAPAAPGDPQVVVELQELLPDDPQPGANFGESVALVGDVAVLGAGMADFFGAAYVFERGPSGWIRTHKLVSSDRDFADYFGESVDFDGNAIAVGAYRDDEGASAAGAAYVFVPQGGGWIQQQKLVAGDAQEEDLFGSGIGISGGTVVVAAEEEDQAGLDAGAAYVFEWTGIAWRETRKVTGADTAAGDRFGRSIAIDGDTFVVGADRADGVSADTGAAYVFVESGGTWVQQAKLVQPDPYLADHFGRSVAISGETIVVGSPYDDDGGSGSGSAYVFVRAGSDWTLEAKLTAGDALPYDRFGFGVAVDGDFAAVGADGVDELGANAGAAYVFTRSAAVWTERGRIPGADPNSWYAEALACSGQTFVAGAQHAPGSAGAGQGRAFAGALVDAFVPYCFGDGSGSACPCGNESAPGAGQGCANSSGAGARLDAGGTSGVAADDLAFDAANLLAAQPALLFAGENAVAGGDGIAFGDGLRCAGQNVVRLGVRIPDAGGGASWGPGLGALGGWGAGDVRRFQAWYRDPALGPCATGFNLSNGVEVLFVP